MSISGWSWITGASGPEMVDPFGISEGLPEFPDNEKISILLVDDDREFAEAVYREGAQRGIHVEQIRTFWDLWGMDLSPYAAVLIDNHLPDVPGIELGQLLAELNISVPVVMLSNKSSWILDRDDWPLCVKEFLPKRRGAPEILFRTSRISRNERYI